MYQAESSRSAWRQGCVMEVQYSKDTLASPDGTPPSQPSLSDDNYRSKCAAPRSSARQPWLGSEQLSGMEKGVPLPKKRNGLANGYTSHAADQPDLLSVMEASWYTTPHLSPV